MPFNPDPSKQAVEITFSKKVNTTNHLQLTFNYSNISRQDVHKHLGLILDSKLSLDHHLKEKISKCNRDIGLIRRLKCLRVTGFAFRYL